MSNELQHKSMSVEIKDADKGLIRVEFATTGVKDLDGDLTLPGAFGSQKAALSSYGHGWRDGNPPIGKGDISETGNKAIGDFKVFMGIASCQEQFAMIKEMGDQQEWSYGFKVLKTGELTEEMRQRGIWRVLEKVKVYEVSPVLLGAGIGTRTVSAKEAGAAGPQSGPHLVFCDCGRCLGESPQSLVFVGKAKEVTEIKVAGPRDVRHCKSCARHAIFIPAAALTKPAA
jgi:hypothetical protein